MKASYDLVLRRGEVIDPSQGIRGIRDIGITRGVIASLGPVIPDSESRTTLDVAGKLVTPGLIDLHAHVASGIIELGADPDEAGVLRGVTSVCDGGSTGASNFLVFQESVIAKAKTNVLCFLHICPYGLRDMPEIKSWNDIDIPATIRTAIANPDVIRGIKVRAVGAIAQDIGIPAIRKAKEAAREAGIPLMVHIGDGLAGSASHLMDAFTQRVIEMLEKGDIISHIYVGQVGSIIKPGQPIPGILKDAITRGVVLDTAHGRPNLSFKVARWGLDHGILPTTISTDLASTNIGGPIFSLLLTMSKFLALGLRIDQVIEMTTTNPARAVGKGAGLGTLKVGSAADISVIEPIESQFAFKDGLIGNQIHGTTLLTPHLTVKDGVVILPKPGAEREIA